MKPADLAYVAGFFDGEGTVAVTRPQGSSYFLLSCVITNTDVEPLVFCKSLFGGSVKGPYSRGPKHKDVYTWNADAKTGEAFLSQVLPYLRVKKARALMALEFRKLFKGKYILPRGNTEMTPARLEKRENVLKSREKFYFKMKKLNKRGK